MLTFVKYPGNTHVETPHDNAVEPGLMPHPRTKLADALS